VKLIDYLYLMYAINYRIKLYIFFKSLVYPSFVSFVLGVCYCFLWSPDWCEQLKILELALQGREGSALE